ncbi:ABC transporter substrate-binding protein SapA [Vibrio maerlii]|uniref:ABC transporter substrate-binding protein SapA n=1 Tax=Vibrio maerlii TaxID=2231648 RepID=UPI000E3DAB9A|nr:ABC transporter substrate-binding protein SapA [Vibrio maerlii]
MNTIIKLICGLFSITILAACSDDVDHSKIKRTGFVYCGQGSPTTFNPQLVDSGITAESLSPQLYSTLLTLNPDSHLPEPSLAAQWQVDETGTIYTFELTPNVEFQTTDWFTPTRPLNAQDVVFSFQRLLDSTHPFHYVNGGNYPWFTGLDFQNLVLDVRAIAPLKVQFTLAQPDNSFLSNIATSHAVILSQEYARQLLTKDEKQKLDSLPVGTGPFYLDEFQPNDLVRLRRHNDYWQGTPKMEQVVFDVSHRGTGTLAKLLRNECDVLTSPRSSQIPIIERRDEVELVAKPSMNVSFIGLNTAHPALNDMRVRKALNLAINRESILDSVYYGTGNIAFTLLPPSSWAYQKDTIQIRYDRNYAQALLNEAGYRDGLELSMWVPLEPRAYNPSPRKTAELIQSNFAQVGIKLNIITEDRYRRSEADRSSDIDLVLTGWIGDTGDPDNFLRPLLSCESERAGINVSLWCNPDFDFLLDLAKETNKKRYRLNLYRQAQNLLNEEFPVIPLAHGVQFQVNSNDLTGFKYSPFNSQPFDQVERRQ